MSNKQKRDNAYYKERLEREHPAIYRDMLAGKYSSDREAFIAAGLKKSRTPLHELKNAWGKASAVERSNFLRWLKAQHASKTTPTLASSSPSPSGLIAVDRRLGAWAKRRIEEIMLRRRMTYSDVMDELGFKRLNASLGRALARGDRLQPDMIDAIEKWLDTNTAV